MKTVIKAFLVSLIIYLVAITGFNYVGKTFPAFREFGHGLLVYIVRLIILYMGVYIFYTGKFSKTFSFLGLRQPFLRPFITGFLASLPFIISWVIGGIIYKVPLSLSSTSIIMLFFAFIGPGLFEEGLFRGVLFNEFSSVTKWYLAALLTGIFFGPAHLANLIVGHNINEVLISIVAGLVMSFPIGYIYYRMKGNLWACVSFHFFVAGSMDALISEQFIKAHLKNITTITTIGLLLSFVLVFILFSNKRLVKFTLAE